MAGALRITLFILAATLCSGQTVSPLVIRADSTPRCQGREITFSITDTTLHNIRWSVLPAREYTATLSQDSSIYRVRFGRPLNYTVQVSASDSVQRFGKTVVPISRSASASFNASLKEQGYPTVLYLTSYASNYTSQFWRFEDGSTESSSYVEKEYNTSGSHTVQLIATGINGCHDTASYHFHIADSSGITLPNIFTPNLDDINDIYRPIARGIKQLQGWVYNREQTLIYQWNTVNGFWDGRTTSGEPCTDGVYIVVVEAVGFDNKKYNLKTAVTLVR